MIEVMRRLDDRFTLDLFLTDNDPDYLDELRTYAASDKRIRFRSPVPHGRDLPNTKLLRHGDIFAPSGQFQLRQALPNKFFEFIQARLAVAIGPSPEMAKFVRCLQSGRDSRIVRAGGSRCRHLPRCAKPTLSATSLPRMSPPTRSTTRSAAASSNSWLNGCCLAVVT